VPDVLNYRYGFDERDYNPSSYLHGKLLQDPLGVALIFVKYCVHATFGSADLAKLS
jgi:hypothetical protein